MRTALFLTFLLLGSLALSSCSTTGPNHRDITLEEAVNESLGSAEAPSSFKQRKKFELCGPVESPLHTSTIPNSIIECLKNSPPNGTEAVMVTYTTEGDPLIHYYRWIPGSTRIEAFTDSSFDRYGSGWEQYSCPAPSEFSRQEDCQ